MVTNKFLTEVQRQQKYLDELDPTFTFPLFNSKKALESQRKSGYRNTASAAREIVDNAIEAKATKVHVVFDATRGPKGGDKKKSVSAVAFIDDGSGMVPKMARYALSWGGGTHFNDSDFIGKFGFGLPNASINQTRRVEVFTRTGPDQAIAKAWLDIDEYKGEGASQDIQPPIEAPLPEFVHEYLDRNGWSFDHGTVVVWVKPDHLSYRRAASLKEHLVDDFGVAYRYLLKGLDLSVEGTTVEPVDPLFLEPAARFFVGPNDGGATVQYEEALPVALVEDALTGERSLKKVDSPAQLDAPPLVAAGTIHVRVGRLPVGFAVGTQTEGIEVVDEHARARFEIRKSRRGMTFIRGGREIETVDAFPRRAADKASGLGDWPLLQAYAYHWGMEVKFTPSLDDVFGITNDKQTIRPIEDFWRLLAAEGIDALLHRENNWQSEQRSVSAKRARVAAKLAETGEPTAAEQAAQNADAALGELPVVPDAEKPTAVLNFDAKAEEDASRLNKSIDETKKTLAQRGEKASYSIEYIDDDHGPFFTPAWVGTQVAVRVNRRHPFFTTLYDSLLANGDGGMAKNAIDVLLIALARGELLAKNPKTKEMYFEQRTQVWSPFLAAALRSLERSMPEQDDDDAVAT